MELLAISSGSHSQFVPWLQLTWMQVRIIIRMIHISLGRIPCWYIHTLYFPCNTLPSVFFSHAWTCTLVSFMLLLSARYSSNHFPKHFIGSSTMVGISSSWMRTFTWLLIRPILSTKHLDLLGLKFIRAQETLSSDVDTTHLVLLVCG